MTFAVRPVILPDQTPDSFEDARLAALERYDILDTSPEEGFDSIVRLMRAIFQTPIAIVSLIDAHRQWFKAQEGVYLTEVPRRDTFCDLTLRSAAALVVADAEKDARFMHSPYVAGEPQLRAYAGVPLVTRDGHAIGTVAVMDTKPRVFGEEQVAILRDLATIAMAEMTLRQHVKVDLPTGVLSRRAFMDEGDQAIALARRHEMELGCIAIGLHSSADSGRADELVADVAATLRRNLRRTDLIGRVGKGQFAVVLPNTNSRGTHDVAEKLRAALETFSIGHDVVVTAGIGAASLDSDIDDLEDLLDRAVVAFAEARAAGGQRSVSWTRPATRTPPAQRSVLKAGELKIDDGRTTVDCTVRSLSSEGAGLDVSSSYGLPEHFALRIRSEGVDRQCRLVSQSERHVQVEFV